MEQKIEELADWVEAAWNRPAAIPEILEHAPGLSVVDGYRVQQARMEKLAPDAPRGNSTGPAFRRHVAFDGDRA